MRRFLLLLAVLIFWTGVASAHAQMSSALTIKVTDADGKAVAGIQITLQDEAVIAHTATTDMHGDATVMGLPGTTVLLVEATFHGQPLLFPTTSLSHTLELPLRVGETQHLPLSLTGRTLAFLPPTLRPDDMPTQAADVVSGQLGVGQGSSVEEPVVPQATSPVRRGVQVVTVLLWALILVPLALYLGWWAVLTVRDRQSPPSSAKGTDQ